MGISKTNLFSVEQNQLAQTAKVLAHPARVAILMHLLETDSCINSHLVEELGLAQATISQHLKELKTAGLIQGTIEGNRLCYCINPQVWLESGQLLKHFFDRYPNPGDCC